MRESATELRGVATAPVISEWSIQARCFASEFDQHSFDSHDYRTWSHKSYLLINVIEIDLVTSKADKLL